MIPPRRWVFDTNTLVSRLLVPASVPARAVQVGLETGDLLALHPFLGIPILSPLDFLARTSTA